MVNFEHASIRRLKEYAEENNIPIMQDAGIKFMVTFLTKNNIKNILEIGTAIGYSAIKMAMSDPDIHITSIEKDETRYLEALKNIKKFDLEKRITLIFNDAANVRLDDKYDLIFIDAAKAQNIHFFEQFERNLKPHGFFLTDNISFHGLVQKDEELIESKNVRGIVRKIKEYIKFLEENEEYNTTIRYELGDGIAISQKRN